MTYTPTVGYNGPDAFTIRVSDGAATADMVVNVSVNAITVANPVSAAATQLVPFSRSFVASGGVALYSYTTASSLPAGLSFTSSGLLHGTPTVTGSFPITVTATDANGCIGVSAVYNLVISAGTIGVARWVNNVSGTRPAQVAVNCIVYNTAATTYTDIQTAINAAGNGDVVYVTDGTYTHTIAGGCSAGLASGNYIAITGKTNLIVTSSTGSYCNSNAIIINRGFSIIGGSNITIQDKNCRMCP